MKLIHNFGFSNLRKLNNTLSLAVFGAGLYILIFPFIPVISYALQDNKSGNPDVVQVTDNSVQSSAPIPDENLLDIPRLGLDEKIHTGNSVSELNKGAWLVPNTSTPDKDSNTVIVGHRSTLSGPGVFYALDRVQVNDRITVSWQNQEYTYKVADIKVVPASTISVHAPSEKAQLTLYTCTPLWSLKDRLVITAPLVGVRG